MESTKTVESTNLVRSTNTAESIDAADISTATKPEDALDPITLSISVEADQRVIETARDRFFHELQELEFEIFRYHRLVEGAFEADKAVNITNFFFCEMIGPAALQHVQDVIRQYATPDKGAARAAMVADDNTFPKWIRRFCKAYSCISKDGPRKALTHLHRTKMHVELRTSHEGLRSMAAQNDKGLVAFLGQRGYRPTKGRGWGLVSRTF